MKKASLLVMTALLGAQAPLFAAAAANGGTSGTGHIQSAVPMPEGEWQIGVSGDYFSGAGIGATKSMPSKKAEEVGRLVADTNAIKFTGANRLDGAFAINYAPLSYLELGGFIPFYKDKTPAGDASGLGDVRLSAKLNYPIEPHYVGYELSYLLMATFPTASKSKNGYIRNAWSEAKALDANERPILDLADHPIPDTTSINPYGAADPVIMMKLLNTINLRALPNSTPILIHYNFGLALSGGSKSQSAFLAGLGLEFWWNDNFAMWYALDGQMNISHGEKNIFATIASYPLSHWMGLSLRTNNNLQIDLGVEMATYNKVESKKFYRTYSNGVADTSFIANRYPDLGYHLGLTYNFGALYSKMNDKK